MIYLRKALYFLISSFLFSEIILKKYFHFPQIYSCLHLLEIFKMLLHSICLLPIPRFYWNNLECLLLNYYSYQSFLLLWIKWDIIFPSKSKITCCQSYSHTSVNWYNISVKHFLAINVKNIYMFINFYLLILV